MLVPFSLKKKFPVGIINVESDKRYMIHIARDGKKDVVLH